MSPGEQAAAVRRSAGLFRHRGRGLVRVSGDDRVRWLNGMISNDVQSLQEGPERSGCYAALLTDRGRIVADLHVLLRGDAFWLELDAASVAPVIERLERFIVADDVVLEDLSASFDRIGVEGPAARSAIERASSARLALAPDACEAVEIAGVPVVIAAFGWSREEAFQLFVASGRAGEVTASLRTAAGEGVLCDAGDDVLEILRIEAGVPLLGKELDEGVFPDEARLERAVSSTKGCYTGQEIIARLRSRGQVNHLLVGLRFDGDPAGPGSEIHADSRRVGEVTSSCVSQSEGPIGLGFVRRGHHEPGTELLTGERRVTVRALPGASEA